MKLLAPLGFVLVLIGSIWTAQGVGWLKGSPMTDETFWAVAGSGTVLVGLLLVVTGIRRGAR